MDKESITKKMKEELDEEFTEKDIEKIFGGTSVQSSISDNNQEATKQKVVRQQEQQTMASDNAS